MTHPHPPAPGQTSDDRLPEDRLSDGHRSDGRLSGDRLTSDLPLDGLRPDDRPPAGRLRIAMVQLCVSDDPARNLPVTCAYVRQAAAGGAQLILTPEATNLLSPDRAHQNRVLHPEDSDPTLSALRAEAKDAGVWLLIGGLALKTADACDSRFVNRSLMIDPQGQIVARYDKLHMFDVTISDTEQFRESAAYRPGTQAVIAPGPRVLGLSMSDHGMHGPDMANPDLSGVPSSDPDLSGAPLSDPQMSGPQMSDPHQSGHSISVGLTICYDLRFPHLYRRLAHGGAGILAVPAAFNPTTGAAHWETLLRSRAIENGCFVLAPAQCGRHDAPHSPDRAARISHGHSLAVDPWGQVLADGGTVPGLTFVDLDLSAIADARSRIPTLTHDRPFDGP